MANKTIRNNILRFSCALSSCMLASQAVVAQDSEILPSRLVVAVRNVAPFSFKNDDDEWTGISIDLLRDIKADFDHARELETRLEFREMTLTEMLVAVEKGEVDLAAAALTVNFEREKRMDFTHAFHSSGLGIAVSGKQVRGWSGVIGAVLSPTFLKIVIGLFAVLMASGVAVYFFERKRNPEFSGGFAKGVASGIWWAAVTMTTVGYGDKVPKSAGGRFIGGIWMFSGLFLVASFTAAVTSALTVTQLRSRVSGPADLTRVQVATVKDTTSEKYLRSRHIIARKYPDVQSALVALRDGKIEAVVYDAAILRYESHQNHSDEVHVLPVTFERQDYAFALPTDSPLRERVNQTLLRKIGSSEWSEVLASYLGESFE